jgi:hypothetical protein
MLQLKISYGLQQESILKGNAVNMNIRLEIGDSVRLSVYDSVCGLVYDSICGLLVSGSVWNSSCGLVTHSIRNSIRDNIASEIKEYEYK